MEINKIYNMDCLDGMRLMDDNSVDTVITDPPYGLKFMGKKWDYDVPSVKIWKECLRVLKPGGYLLSFGGTRTCHRLTCAIEDAGFEIRDMICWIYGCYSSDTEVLTQRGWLEYTELIKEDFILQWDRNTNKLSWYKPKNFFEYKVKDEMVLFENRHTSQLITKNHSVYAKIRKHSRNLKPTVYEKVEAQNIRKHWYIDLPLAGELDSGIIVDYPYLIGWWLTDAWVHADGKASMFSQCKPRTRDKLRKYLIDNNFKFSEYIKKAKRIEHQDEHTFYVTGDIARYLLSNYPNREMSWKFLGWNQESRFLLLEGLLDGDGSRSTDRGYSEVFWSKKPERLDIVQALCVSLNIRSYIDYKKGCVYLNRARNSTQLQSKHKKPLQNYEGKVWCLETETGAFVVRRNGRAFISGNSGFPKSHNISKAIDKKAGAEREVIGISKNKSGIADSNLGEQSRDTDHAWSRGKSVAVHYPLTASSTPEAQLWDGWGTALKPALEPITVAMKPFKGTFAENALKWGVAGYNIDGGRIGNKKIMCGNAYSGNNDKRYNWNNGTKKEWIGNISQGRFPSNIILDEEAGRLLDEQAPHTGQLAPTTGNEPSVTTLNQIYGDYRGYGNASQPKDKLAGASRFFKIIEHDDIIYTKSILNRKILDKLCYEHLNVKIVEKNLMIMYLIDQVKINSAQRNVLPSLISQNQNLNALFVEKKSENIEIKHVQELVQILTDGIQEYMVTGQLFLTIYVLTHLQLQGIIILTQNLAYSVGRKEKSDIMRIIQNLKILFGCVEVVMTNTIATRFKYQAKASKTERNKGCDDLPEKEIEHNRFDKCQTCGGYILQNPDRKSACKCSNPIRQNNTIRGNHHPTLKPLKLMEYLCTLTKTPTGGIVLDPFLGSGTTAIACKLTGRDFIGFEIDEDYYNIALKRIGATRLPIQNRSLSDYW